MLGFKKFLTEASLSRVWQHTKSDRPYALFTAFRDEYSYDENVRRNKEVAEVLKRNKIGYFFVDGAWIENKGTDDEVEVKEDSIFAIGQPGKEEAFKELIISLGKKYDQDAVIVRTGDTIGLYDKQGNTITNFSKLVVGKLGDMYTRLRKGSGRTFVFEPERAESNGFFSRLVDKYSN